MPALSPATSILHNFSGGTELFDWFGHVPHFHDANLLAVRLADRSALLRIHTWEMTDKTDAGGVLILDRHVVVTIELQDVSNVLFVGENGVPAIIGTLDIAQDNDGYVFEWDTSYGVEGSIRAQSAIFHLAPGKPASAEETMLATTRQVAEF